MQNGRTFRPSDWVDRVSGVLAIFGADHRLRYGAVRPCFIQGKKCLLVKKSLEQDNPAAFAYVCEFVRTNGLEMTDFAAEVETAESDNEESKLEAVA